MINERCGVEMRSTTAGQMLSSNLALVGVVQSIGKVAAAARLSCIALIRLFTLSLIFLTSVPLDALQGMRGRMG